MKFLDLEKNSMNGQLEAHFDDWKITFTDEYAHDEIQPIIAVYISHKSGWHTGNLISVPNEDWFDECWMRAHAWAIEFLEIIGVIDEIP